MLLSIECKILNISSYEKKHLSLIKINTEKCSTLGKGKLRCVYIYLYVNSIIVIIMQHFLSYKCAISIHFK